MSSSERVWQLLDNAQEAQQFAAIDDDSEKKAGWVRAAALSLLLAERLFCAMAKAPPRAAGSARSNED